MIHSTRSKTEISASEAIINGLAPDGGLYVFENLDPLDFGPLKNKSYQEVAEVVLGHLLTDFTPFSLKNIVKSTYNESHFPEGPVTIKDMGNYSYLNLYNGPTFAFKDMALSILPKLVREAKLINNSLKKNIVLTATSGDTGSAALSGFTAQKGNHIIVLYPTEGISEFQEKQMNAFQSDTAKVFALEGNFDDCQNIVKELFLTVKPKYHTLTSANSINIGRLAPQVVYYVYTYLHLWKTKKIRKNGKFNVCVPTGNFGNIYAAYIAKTLGVPIQKLIVASNQNNVLDDFFKTGKYNIDRKLHKSISPSMDIIISSNLERFIFNLTSNNVVRTRALMQELSTFKTVSVEEVKNIKDVLSGHATEQDTFDTIRKTYSEDEILIDTHTAVAKSVFHNYQQESNDKTHTVIVSTASPYKFSQSVLKALDKNYVNLFDNLKTLESLDKNPIDPRFLDTLNSETKKIVLNKENALEILKKEIFDIDQS